VAALVARIYPEIPPAMHRAAGRSLLAHLLKLAAEDRARETEAGWLRATA
jgi:hypothetical protein